MVPFGGKNYAERMLKAADIDYSYNKEFVEIEKLEQRKREIECEYKKIENKKNEELVSVFIPKQSRNDTERFVAVNGERILVQTGKTVEVPKRFAEVIKNSEQMAAVSAAYIDANISI